MASLPSYRCFDLMKFLRNAFSFVRLFEVGCSLLAWLDAGEKRGEVLEFGSWVCFELGGGSVLLQWKEIPLFPLHFVPCSHRPNLASIDGGARNFNFFSP